MTPPRKLVPGKRGELPIFSLQRLDFDGASTTSPSAVGARGKNLRAASASWSILAVAVGNGALAMATSDCCVIRWNAEREGEAEGEKGKGGGEMWGWGMMGWGGIEGGVGHGGEMYSLSCSAVVLRVVDPRIRTMPGRRALGFHQPGRHCLYQARPALSSSASEV